MALATKCPHCNTIFKVAADQLKLRGGIVRCGACKEVFDGNAALLHNAALTPAAPAKARPAPAPAAAVSAHPEPAAAVCAPGQAWQAAAQQKPDESAYALDFDLASEPLPLLAPGHGAAGYEDEDDLAFDLDLDLDVGSELPPEGHAPTPLESEPSAVWRTPPPPRFELPEPAAAPEIEIQIEPEPEPEFPPAARPGFGPEPEFAAHIEPEAKELAAEADELTDVAPQSSDARREPTFDIQDDDETDDCIVKLSAPESGFAGELANQLAGKPAVDARAEPSLTDAAESEQAATETPAAVEPPPAAGDDGDAHDEAPAASADEPGFVKQGRRRQRIRKAMRILMGFGSVLLLIALPIQGVTTFRNQVAAQLPQLKPALESACAALGCIVELPAQIDMLTIEQGELQAIAENTFSYATVLHNQGSTPQAWPSIELILNDAKDKPVLRRVIAPADYLAAPDELKKGFAPRSEHAIKLFFELNQLKASGYHVAIFYP